MINKDILDVTSCNHDNTIVYRREFNHDVLRKI